MFLDFLSIVFAGSTPADSNGEKYLLIAVDHLKGWPTARATSRDTLDMLVYFVKDDVIYTFGPRRTIISAMPDVSLLAKLSSSY